MSKSFEANEDAAFKAEVAEVEKWFKVKICR